MGLNSGFKWLNTHIHTNTHTHTHHTHTHTHTHAPQIFAFCAKAYVEGVSTAGLCQKVYLSCKEM